MLPGREFASSPARMCVCVHSNYVHVLLTSRAMLEESSLTSQSSGEDCWLWGNWRKHKSSDTGTVSARCVGEVIVSVARGHRAADEMRSSCWYCPRVQLNICASCLPVSPLDPSHLFVLSLYFHSLPPLPFQLLSFFPPHVSSISLHSCSAWIQTELLVSGCCSYSLSKSIPLPVRVLQERPIFPVPLKGSR